MLKKVEYILPRWSKIKDDEQQHCCRGWHDIQLQAFHSYFDWLKKTIVKSNLMNKKWEILLWLEKIWGKNSWMCLGYISKITRQKLSISTVWYRLKLKGKYEELRKFNMSYHASLSYLHKKETLVWERC